MIWSIRFHDSLAPWYLIPTVQIMTLVLYDLDAIEMREFIWKEINQLFNEYWLMNYYYKLLNIMPKHFSNSKQILHLANILALTYSWTEGFGRCTRVLKPLWKPSAMFHLNPVVVELLACWSEIDTATTGIEYLYCRGWLCMKSWSALIHGILFSYHTFICRCHARLTSPDT